MSGQTTIAAVAVAALSLLAAVGRPALAQEERLEVTVVTDEAEAVLAILESRSRGAEPEAGAWERLFGSEGYRRLKEREAAMRVPFTDDEFRAFVEEQSLAPRRSALRETLDAWTAADAGVAARRAFAYLPPGAAIRAKVYPVIKPKSNSFVFDLDGDPAVFLYVDPEVGASRFESTVAHELHHIGVAEACSDSEAEGPPGVRTALQWMSALSEGLAMLAAAGGPDVHPHAASDPEERAVWDRHVANVARELGRLESFLLDVAEERLTDPEEIRTRGFSFISSDGVPQGAFYTVGWHIGATIERELGRERLLAVMCDRAELVATYDRAARAANERGEDLPLFSERLLEILEAW